MTLTIVPWGNARETNGSVVCQHGPNECISNKLHACAISIAGSSFLAFPFIHCMEAAKGAPAAAPGCAKGAGLAWASINACAAGAAGTALEHDAAQRTAALSPQHTYVPWVLLNGKPLAGCDEGRCDVVAAVCAAYTGPRPADCPPAAPAVLAV